MVPFRGGCNRKGREGNIYDRFVGELRGPPGARRRHGPPVEETSAGGLVIDRSGGCPRAALIGRRGRDGEIKWSLPKGHVEADETPEQAALREVSEETGIEGRVVRPIGMIDYWFTARNHQIHKTVHHFLLAAVGGALHADDIEVDVTAWVPLAEVTGQLAFDNERALVAGDPDLLAEIA